MDRRHVLKTSTLGVLASAFGARAQQRKSLPHRIGLLSPAYFPNAPSVQGLKTGLQELGFEEGRDVLYEATVSEGDPQRLRASATALVNAKVDVIFSEFEIAARAGKDATDRIPIVFSAVGDPVATGLVKAIAHPGANITGVSGLTTDLAPKRLEWLKAVNPALRLVWAVYDTADPSSRLAAQKAASVASALRLSIVDRPVRSTPDAIAALKAIPLKEGLKHGLLAPLEVNLGIQGSIIDISPWVPSVFDGLFWVQGGALMSYGADHVAMGRQAARLVAKILRGERSEDLPVEGANRIELVINLKAAKQLRLTVPDSVLKRADRVIGE